MFYYVLFLGLWVLGWVSYVFKGDCEFVFFILEDW